MNGPAPRRLPRVWVAALVLLAAGSTPAAAQIFSPGPLAKAHSKLEGMGNCKQCHGDDSQHDDQRCLECHKEIGTRVSRDAGYHARVKGQQCAGCHRDHRGVGASLLQWPSGSARSFNHALAQWPLQGKHKQADCRDCHEARRLEDKDAIKLRAEGRETYLGLPTRCRDCHFDEHRSSNHGDRPGLDCARCHTPDDFEKAPLFNHNKREMASFALTGKHRRVACNKCHDAVVDDDTPAGAFPAPQAREYLQMNDIPHQSCVDCHDDVHRGSFGGNCTQCHTTSGWRDIVQGANDFGFHEKTNFPLRGAHTAVACRTCHGPFPRQPAVFKGLKHERCAQCHLDAHLGQIDVDEKGAVPCERCHTVNGFVPVVFDAVAHAQTTFPLEGAHNAVACTACHTQDARLTRRVPQAVRAKVERQRRSLLLSPVRLSLPGLTRLGGGDDAAVRCESCHSDPHAGQFKERIAEQGCNGCHQGTSFRDERFDHNDSRFPLEGKHKDVACAACHRTEDVKGKRADVVRYRPLATGCQDCHADEHVGQLAKDGVTDCTRCHSPKGFVPSSFRHDDPKQTRFVLEGKHQDVKCAKCHIAVRVPEVDADDETTARYRPVPMDCAACHADEHQRRFDRFAP